MRISDVLASLRIEFPAVTTSKLRFLEEQGLVEPVRTAAGYRQYSPADIERLRFVLRQQRDRYMPLKVIGDRLAALDAGEEDEPAPRARLATRDGVAEAPGTHLTLEALAGEAGVEVEFVRDLLAAGVLRTHKSGAFDLWAREIVVAAAALAEHGIDARHLRQFRTSADRQADLVEQVVAPWRGQRSASSRARAGTLAAEVGELCTQMHTALVRAAVADLTP
ncbi:MerR family transcriptional regulator [Cellulomonas sp. zg-ZUI188]|uniref:MerR family transcriptional regulator n=2 Tax=Cellulomonas fengjieae TaxID=2819978 RepID=A0ABS3SIP3_9CELL|nr:MerR family transcriptional regulator [Cellulomonas fengjieae]MBO3102721.1 MerR family transcriptional regulator [Cellulomonas fengjieae]QVI67869.1 MerR family transcriptional regulator [Cellulomonas fengjieae]